MCFTCRVSRARPPYWIIRFDYRPSGTGRRVVPRIKGEDGIVCWILFKKTKDWIIKKQERKEFLLAFLQQTVLAFFFSLQIKAVSYFSRGGASKSTHLDL